MSGVGAFQLDAFQRDAFQISTGVSTPCFSHTCFDPNCFYDDAGAAPSPAEHPGGGFGEEKKRKPRKSQKQRAEYHLERALEKAFEPKRPVQRDLAPWLVEPVLPTPVLDIPEFNPQIAGLGDYVEHLKVQLAQRKFELAQMEADDELILLSL